MTYPFFLEELYPITLIHKKMFGVDAYYIGDKIMFVLKCNDKHIEDNGIWLATTKDRHEKLKEELPSLRTIQMYGIKSWLILPEDSDTFEIEARKIAAMIKENSDLIGNVPKPKKRKGSK